MYPFPDHACTVWSCVHACVHVSRLVARGGSDRLPVRYYSVCILGAARPDFLKQRGSRLTGAPDKRNFLNIICTFHATPQHPQHQTYNIVSARSDMHGAMAHHLTRPPSYRAQEPGHRPEAWVETVEELFSSAPQLELESRGASLPLPGAPRPSLTQDHTHCRLGRAGKRCYGPQRLSGGRGTGRSDAAPHEPQPRRGWEHWHNRSSKGGTRRCVHDCRLLRSC